MGLAVAGFPEGTISVFLGRRRRQIVLVLRPLITSNPRAEDDDGQETIWGHLAKVLAISSLSWALNLPAFAVMMLDELIGFGAILRFKAHRVPFQLFAGPESRIPEQDSFSERA